MRYWLKAARERLPIILATALVGITGQALNWSLGACVGAMLACQFILVLLSLRP
jgi:hypothetical protein